MPPHAKVHVISGLPRSGSTLLSALLRQNPRFHAGVSSPACSLMTAVLPRMSGTAEFAPFFDEERRGRVLRSLFWAYHDTPPEDGVLFDTNRSWTARMGLVDRLFPSARVICCVRDVPWVIDSMEAMVRRNPTHTSRTFDAKVARNIYGRVEQWMEPQRGLIGAAWSSLREAWFGEHANKLVVVRYESLTRQSRETMDQLYQALGEASFQHDFDNVLYDEEQYDAGLGTPGLHTVRRQVAFVERPTILPPDIFCQYADNAFWLNEKLNAKRVLVI
ncbi:sulfotransferase [Rhodanobacter sp. DHB23]|uniref:sulfotransferase family protein n=1 Tax=Rhodanobacter sp. DHB23 TaxID=2775923 RepID=UPI0017834752|nr:sulfotransferase [Rhodanobacter sp. DHB23]MBD8871342.1 sulfotransferase [Rhodanobacter sp. DHB23]